MISKDMTIAKILEEYPERAVSLSERMSQAGLHCVGCHASPFESIEEGMLSHGMDASLISPLVDDLNMIISVASDQKKKEQNISFSNAAAAHAKQLQEKADSEGKALRLQILKGGCAGYSYKMSFDRPRSSDALFQFGDLQVCVDSTSLEQLDGIEIDYVESLEETGFTFHNPKVHASCDCGKSFR